MACRHFNYIIKLYTYTRNPIFTFIPGIRMGSNPKYGRKYTTALSMLICSILLVLVNAVQMIIGKHDIILPIIIIIN